MMTTDTTTDPAVAALLRAARARIADKRHWTHNSVARDRHGHPVEIDSPTAVRWCAVGATGRTDGSSYADEALDAAAKLLFGCGITIVNDFNGHAAVLACYDAAIARAEGASE